MTDAAVIVQGVRALLVAQDNEKVLIKEQRVAASIRADAIPIPGPPGAPAQPYEHEQASASALWTVAHNLGHWPSVTVFTVGGVEVIAHIVNLSTDTLQIAFDEAMAGRAICI